MAIRHTGEVDQEVLTGVLAMLDLEETMLSIVSRRVELPDESALSYTPAHAPCAELEGAPDYAMPTGAGCAECERDGLVPVHLRLCLTCGNVGCCDSSVGRHATGHFEATGHPVMRSFEPGESWRWCYVHNLVG